jgi:hypothetical protein
LEPEDPQDDNNATPDDIRAAIEELTNEEAARLRKVAKYCLFGTEYQNPQELINEAILRAMSAAHGDQGRRWKKSVPFMAFLVMTIKGIANDSQESLPQTRTDYIDAMATESLTAEDALGTHGHSNPGVEELAIDIEETQERQERAKQDAAAIDARFEGDDDINWIIMGYKDGQTAAEIREISGMTNTQYETAKRRFRRGLEKMPLNRSKS